MTNYIIELSIIHIVLILGYWLILKKEQQHAIKRYFLIIATLLALGLPLLKLPKLFINQQVAIYPTPTEVVALNGMTSTSTTEVSAGYHDVLLWVYATISLLLLLVFLNNLLRLIQIRCKSRLEKINGLSIRKVKDIDGSFSFFNWIFLGDGIDSKDYELILKHETGHTALGHTYDLIFFELFKVCFWWLPTTWLTNKEIREIHEYQADAYALRSYDVKHYASKLISATLKSNGLRLASSFHDGLILQRLTAMKQNAKKVSPWKFGVLSTLCAMLFIVFSCSEDLTQQPPLKSKEDVFAKGEVQPGYEGGMGAFYQYVGSQIIYPKEARNKRIEGRVFVQFVVEKDGTLSNVETVKGIGGGCDEEAIRVVQSANVFKPGIQRGKPVRVRMMLPIIFKLGDKSRPELSENAGIIIIEEANSKLQKLRVEANYANGEWLGTIFDKQENEGLPGANILVVGTNTGMASELDGSFRVKAKQQDNLVVSFVGYESVLIENN